MITAIYFGFSDKTLLIKSSIVLSCVMVLFFMQNIPSLNLSLGWTSLIGAITLLILQVGFNCNLVVISSMIRVIIDGSQIFYLFK